MKIAVVGLGVVGGSYVKSLKGLGHEVYGVDIDEQTLKNAKIEGCILEGFVNPGDIIHKMDLVILCLYPKDVLEFIKNNNFKKDCVITDATGVKKHFIEKALKYLPKDVELLSGHPMAGREKKGYDYASEKVFNGANYILIKHQFNKESTLSMMSKLVQSIGFVNVTILTIEQHDQIISFTSQLPHVIAVALINSDKQMFDTGKFIGDSYRDLTRIANINEVLWSELFIYNKNYLIDSINDFEEQLTMFKAALISDNSKILQDMFIESSKRRQSLEK